MIVVAWVTMFLAICAVSLSHFFPILDVVVITGLVWATLIGLGGLIRGPLRAVACTLADRKRRKALGSGELNHPD